MTDPELTLLLESLALAAAETCSQPHRPLAERILQFAKNDSSWRDVMRHCAGEGRLRERWRRVYKSWRRSHSR